jgi:hypothetical protein
MSPPMRIGLLAVPAVFALLGSGCAGSPRHAEPGAVPRAAGSQSIHSADVQPYLDLLDDVARDAPERQNAELNDARAAIERDPTPANRLRYALILGTAGRPGSDPVEARRLVLGLLADPAALSAHERSLANAFLQEFDARVALYAELGRQREEFAARLASRDADADQRVESAVAENAKLRRALAEADRKLKAVADMERQLLDQATDAAPSTARPPQQ